MGRPRSYSDHELAQAVLAAESYDGVLRNLGIVPGGQQRQRVRKRIAELALDTAHFSRRSKGQDRSRWWTDQDLRRAVAQSESWRGVARSLGVSAYSARARFRVRAAQLRLDTHHFYGRGWSPASAADPSDEAFSRPAGRRRWTDAELADAVRVSRSIAQVLAALGLRVGGGQYRVIKRRIAELQLSTEHFTGQGWSRGTQLAGRRARPLEDLLREGSEVASHDLKLRLLREGIKERRCEGCGLTEWQAQPVPLQLDHINGEPTDNRLENLRLLCPNCHALTDTYCGRNIRRDTQ